MSAGRPLVEFILEVELLARIWRELDERTDRAPHRLVVPHLAVVLVVLTRPRSQPPDGLEAHVGVGLAPDLPRHLRHVLKPPLAEHLEDLAVPLVVLRRG